MRSVLLVNPRTENKSFHPNRSKMDRLFEFFFNRFYDRHFRIPIGANCTTMPPVTLYALHALLKDRCSLSIIDEQVEEIDFETRYDLVCITSTTTQMIRAREISQTFRAKCVRT